MKQADRVVEALLAMVREHGLKVGDRLPAERQLAPQLGVSRPALREALQKLVAQGVLRSKRGDGTYVQFQPRADWLAPQVAPLVDLMGVDPSYRYDVLETRQTLEMHAAACAALRATPADRARIRTFYEDMLQSQAAGQAEQAAMADAQFHLAVTEAAHNVVLLQVMRGLFSVVQATVQSNRFDMFRLNPADPTQRLLNGQHRRLLEAIEQGDPDAARAAMGEHLDHVRRTLHQQQEDLDRQARSQRVLPAPESPR